MHSGAHSWSDSSDEENRTASRRSPIDRDDQSRSQCQRMLVAFELARCRIRSGVRVSQPSGRYRV